MNYTQLKVLPPPPPAKKYCGCATAWKGIVFQLIKKFHAFSEIRKVIAPAHRPQFEEHVCLSHCWIYFCRCVSSTKCFPASRWFAPKDGFYRLVIRWMWRDVRVSGSDVCVTKWKRPMLNFVSLFFYRKQ